jgi:large subunit ribosomal protein L21
MYAIIDEGGRQHKVSAGDLLKIDRQVGEDDKSITFDRVLMVGGGDQPRVGAPMLEGVTVTADVLGPAKGPKLVLQKHKRRKGYSKKQGHRQHYTQVRITAINA